MNALERVAKAMRDELGVDWPYTGHAELMDVARAAVEALRDPPEEIARYADKQIRAQGMWTEVAEETVWELMLDAILNEKEST